MARSLVIMPDSIVSMHALSRLSENFFRASLLSSLALCASPRVQAKMEASIKKSYTISEVSFIIHVSVELNFHSFVLSTGF